jgi:hypothetical protein
VNTVALTVRGILFCFLTFAQNSTTGDSVLLRHQIQGQTITSKEFDKNFRYVGAKPSICVGAPRPNDVSSCLAEPVEPQARRALFVSQGDYGIDARRAPCRYVACRKRYAREDDGDGGKRKWIGGFHAEEQCR